MSNKGLYKVLAKIGGKKKHTKFNIWLMATVILGCLYGTIKLLEWLISSLVGFIFGLLFG